MRLIILGILLIPELLLAQNELNGKVYTLENNEKIPLENVDIRWGNNLYFSQSDAQGNFSITYKEQFKHLIFSYVGYETDTVFVENNHFLEHKMTSNLVLEEVKINVKKKDFQISHSGINFGETLNSGELLKAACCNLSESFETNPSVDASFTDAVTGIKQIQLLGLNSPYIQFTQENIPTIKGANQLLGFGFVPGTWIESIQISKGAGSVINGYESISGQINFELKKPQKAEMLFLNMYGSQSGRWELNADHNLKLNDRWSYGIYVHSNFRTLKSDHNSDGFLDEPLGHQWNIMNRWTLDNVEKNYHSSLIVNYITDRKQAGQVRFNPEIHRQTSEYWGMETDVDRWDMNFKLGKVFPDLPYKSMGFQANFSLQNQESYYGLNTYDIQHKSMYFNYIYQSILSNTYHKFKSGISFNNDNFKEFYNTTDFSRTDWTLGSFFEYNYDSVEKWSVNAGIRADYHNVWKMFVTPRLHLRYSPFENTTLRTSVGYGRRTANVFVENPQIFISNRKVQIVGNDENAYGLQPEKAWNFGVSILQNFRLVDRNATLTGEFYFTDFDQQVVVDMENARLVKFYNLQGTSHAKSFQIMANFELLKGLEFRTAYKNTKQMLDYSNEYLQKPLQAQHRFFANLAYKSPKTDNGAYWHLDVTTNFIGKMRFPDTSGNPESYQLPSYSEPYQVTQFQLNRFFSNTFSLYFGGENIFGFQQMLPILSHQSPFSDYFDGSMVYAPINGAMFYGGLRFSFN